MSDQRPRARWAISDGAGWAAAAQRALSNRSREMSRTSRRPADDGYAPWSAMFGPAPGQAPPSVRPHRQLAADEDGQYVASFAALFGHGTPPPSTRYAETDDAA